MSTFLSIDWNLNPEIFSIGVLRLGYYNLLFLLGFITGYYLGRWILKREHLQTNMIDSIIYWMFFSTAIGARLGHCLFYDPVHYLSHPIEILKMWEGGLASHGGVIGILFGMWLFVRKYGTKFHITYIWLLDRISIPAALSACFIRLGNLMNSEIYGVETTLPWGVVFLRKGEMVPKHPTQVYEALCYLLIFFFLLWLYRRWLPKIKEGMLLGLLLITVFTSRFFIEFIKNTQMPFEVGMKLDMGQWLSIPFVLFGVGILIYASQYGKPAILLQQMAVKQPSASKQKPIHSQRLNHQPPLQGEHKKDGNRLGKRKARDQ